jgi:putative ABC transport system substrate-binding protein
MNRRESLAALVGLFATAQARHGLAQPARPLPKIGVNYFGQRVAGAVILRELEGALAALGYQDGKTAIIETRFANGSADVADAQARELAALGCRVIIAQGGAGYATRKLNGSVPIVMAFSGNPVDAGFTTSLSHPDRGMTGMSYMSLDLVGKRIELLKEAIPSIRRIAVIANPAHAGDRSELDASRKAAEPLGLAISYHAVRKPDEAAPVFQTAVDLHAQAIVIFPDAITLDQRARLAELSLAHRIPTISGWAVFADAGHLFAYGPNLRASYRRVAYYVDRILRGAKPAELPIEFPREVELVVNTKTATALGIAIPQAILVRADRII